MSNTNSLNFYGYNFQIKVLSCLMTDKIFYLQINDILLPDYFESAANKWILNVIKDYYHKYNLSPTKDVFKIEIQKIENELLKLEVIEHFKEVLNAMGSEDLQYIKDEILIFCRNQELKKAIEESIVLLEDGKYDDIKVAIDKASKAGTERFNYYDYKTEITSRYEEEDRCPIPTTWDIINEITGGGLAAGELGAIISSAGGGKSWTLVNIGGAAIKAGKTVFHYTLELYENYTGKRYDSLFSGIAFQNLKYNVEDIKNVVSKLPGNLIVEYAPAGSLTVSQMKGHVEKSIINGIKPDLIIVDYADLLRGVGKYANKEKRHELGNIYVDLRGLAGELRIPIWTASQGNRSSSESEIIVGSQVSEDYSKIMTCDLVISLARPLKTKLGGHGSWHIIKNRFGPDGLTFPSKINTTNGSIQIFEENSIEGKSTKISIQNGEDLIKKQLASKFEQFKGAKGQLTKFSK